MTDLEKFNRLNVGAVIHALRINDLNIKQEKLSIDLRISQGSISKIENGVLEIGVSLYHRLLKYFDISPDEFSELLDIYIKESLDAQRAEVSQQSHYEIDTKVANHAVGLRSIR